MGVEKLEDDFDSYLSRIEDRLEQGELGEQLEASGELIAALAGEVQRIREKVNELIEFLNLEEL